MIRYGQCSDEELIERLRNGESEIFGLSDGKI